MSLSPPPKGTGLMDTSLDKGEIFSTVGATGRFRVRRLPHRLPWSCLTSSPPWAPDSSEVWGRWQAQARRLLEAKLGAVRLSPQAERNEGS